MEFPRLDQRSATLTDYGISGGTEESKLHVFLTFDVEDEGKLTYFGYLHGGALKFTLEALAAVGYKGKDCSDLVDGPDGGALVLWTKVMVAVCTEEYQGEKKRRIKFVNSALSKIQRADPITAKAKLRALGIETELAKYRSINGGAKNVPSSVGSSDDIPF